MLKAQNSYKCLWQVFSFLAAIILFFLTLICWSKYFLFSIHRNSFHSIKTYMSCLMTKPTKRSVRPAKTQISLGIRPVWSESSLCAQWEAEDPSFLHEDRLGGCPGWSESSLGAHAILMVLSWAGSHVYEVIFCDLNTPPFTDRNYTYLFLSLQSVTKY